MAYFKPSYGVNGLGIPMGPMDAATLHHSMGYATGEILLWQNLIQQEKTSNITKNRYKKVSYFITRQIFNILILNLFLLFSVIVHNPYNSRAKQFFTTRSHRECYIQYMIFIILFYDCYQRQIYLPQILILSHEGNIYL